MKNSYNCLYLEDQPEDVELLTETLKREYLPCEVTWVNGREAFESALTGGWSYDLIFADYALPDIHGDEALAIAKRRCPEVPFIFISGNMGEEKAVECLRNGATDYVLKSNLGRLAPVVRRALDEARESAGRREAENATTRVVSLLRATLESTAEGILVVDLAGKISTYNRKFMSLCGIPDYVMAPMEMDRVLQFLLDQFQDPEAFLSEARLLGSHPERESFGMLNFKGERVLEEYSRPHRVGDQTVGRVYTFHDVTAREKATTQLAGLAGIRQKLLEAAHAGGLVLWCLGEDSLLLSENAAEVLDLQSGEVPGDLPALEALIHPDELDRFRQALEHPTAGSFEVRMRKGSGIWIWTRWNLERDQELGYRGSFRDYTAHRRAEEAFADLRRTMGMAFLAENSTRIQGPIIRNAQEALAEIAQGGPLDEAQQAGLRRAQGAIGEMEAFLREGTMATRCEPDTSRLLDFGMLEETFRAQTEPCLGSGIRLKVHFASRLPALAMNEAHLRLALLDLCLNARDALQGKGTITLSLEPGRPEGLWVEVRDDGPGIPPAVLNRMFDPFFSTGKNAHGLGLTVVKAIVEAYHGTIQVESQPGEGTCVRLQLPAGN